MWLQYTLDSVLTKSSLSNVLFIAQRQTQTQIRLGFGSDRIGQPEGQYRYDIGGVVFNADDAEATSPQHLTWKELLKAIELIEFCITGEGIYKEIEAELYDGPRKAGIVKVKRLVDDETD